MAKITFPRGTTHVRTGTVSIDDSLADLTTATIRFTIKPEQYDSDADDSDATLKKDITDGTAEGEYTITIEPGDTDLVEPGKYYYDVMCEFADGSIYQIDSGTIKLTGTPTNRQD